MILLYRVTKVLGDTDYVDIKMRVASTGRMGWMAHRKWKEVKLQPGTAGPGNMLGCC